MINIYERSKNVVAQGCLTNSKSPDSHVFGVTPTHVKYGVGGVLIDHNDKHYIDYICGLGANLMGYDFGFERTKRSIGVSHSLPTEYEVEYAEMLKDTFPFSHWKFLKTGNEACLGAVKIARAYNQIKRENKSFYTVFEENALLQKKDFLVLCEGYHGHGDMFTSLTKPAWGVPPDSNIEKLEPEIDPYQIQKADAVIVEPVITDWSEERKNWLRRLRQYCNKYHTVLIFDEVITGFRWLDFSVTNNWGIRPDLLVIGKSIANGFPLAAIGGPMEMMNNPYFVSSTFAGDIVSLQEAIHVLKTLKENPDYDINKMWLKGIQFIDSFNSLSKQYDVDIEIDGYPTRGVFKGEETILAIFFQECIKKNILFGKSWMYNFPLMQFNEKVLSSIEEIFKNFRFYKLEGRLPQSPFSAKVRNHD